MNIVFFGSSNFAVSALKSILASPHKVSCVVTQPDKKKGRGLNLSETAVKNIAKESDLRIYQPARINEPEAVNFLKGLDSDIFVVIAYGQILSDGILTIPKTLSINVHASYLPKYRGAAPINWAIINGEKTTGVSIIKMSPEMDAGPIILQKKQDIDRDDTTFTLEDKLSQLAAGLLLDVLELIEWNTYKFVDQDVSKVTFAPRLKKEDGLINWNKPATDIYNIIRGCLKWPGAFTYYNEKLLKIYKAKVIDLSKNITTGNPGNIVNVSKSGVTIVTGKGYLLIEELQIEGKRRMPVKEFISGYKLRTGDTLGI